MHLIVVHLRVNMIDSILVYESLWSDNAGMRRMTFPSLRA